MFVARFSQVDSSSNVFKADKNGNLPVIGEVLAGSAKGTLINGTMFQRNGLIAGKLYLCDNHIDPEYPESQQVSVIGEVSTIEFMTLRTQLGAGKLIKATETVEEAAPAVQEPTLV